VPLHIETKLDLGFRIIRLIDDSLISSNCYMTVSIDLVGEPETSMAKARLKAMKLWTHAFLDGCIAYDVHTKIDTTLLESLSNHIMMCPDDPHDYLLLAMIHSKLTAIAGDDIVIRSTMLSTDTGEGFSNTIHGAIEDALPSMTEWVGPRSFWSVPWWSRADSSMMDIPPESSDDLTKKPHLGDDLLLMINEEDDIRTDKPAAEIIKPQFKPRVIDDKD